MRDYQKELDALRQRIANQRENLRVLEQLRRQEQQCQQALSDCRRQYEEERKDVDRLERLSWSAIWSSIKGSKEEDLDREKAEAWTARLKLQEAQRQLEEVRAEIADRKARLDDSCEAEYQKLLQEKEREYRKKDPVLAEKLADIERRELDAATERKELNEALYAGSLVLSQIQAALSKLDDAEGWSTWDLMGGGLVADMMKYSSMDEAQTLMEGVQSDLRRYQAELADVAREAEFSLQQDGFTQAMDVWFDSFFADWAVRDRIVQSGDQLRNVECRVQTMQRQLNEQLTSVQQRMDALRQERMEIVRDA